MKYIPLTDPVIGRIYGYVAGLASNSPGSGCSTPTYNPVAKAVAVPVQPATNSIVNSQAAMAAAAVLWASLTIPQQALWNNYPVLGALGYNNFIAFNTLQFQWGLDPFIAPPGFNANTEADLLVIYSEPDGIHSTLVAFPQGTPKPGTEIWLHVYACGSGLTFEACTDFENAVGTASFLGSFGPLPAAVVSYFDVTDALTALGIGWQYPPVLDTTSMTSCGGNTAWVRFYSTDQFGRPTSNYLPELGDVDGVFGADYTFGPGYCPLTGPPYPWPPSH